MISRRRLLDYCFLTSLVNEEHEAYFPTAGPAYLARDYFRPATLGRARGWWKNTLALIDEGRAPKELGLYVHWPFCSRRCAFCFCSTRVPKDAAEVRDYAAGLKAEMDSLKDLFGGRAFGSVYFGGGTPTFGDEEVLDDLLTHLRRSFKVASWAEFYYEASPATLTPEKMRLLRRHGVNHVTLGVQTMDPGVLKRIDRRGQTREVVDKAYGLMAREKGLIRSVDLMYGLEGQGKRSFLSDVVWAMKRRCHNLRIYAFDPRPQTRFASEGKPVRSGFREDQFTMMRLLDKATELYGYRLASSHPDFKDYLCGITRQCRVARRWGASVLGFGPSALSHAFGSAWYRRPVAGGARFEGFPSGLLEEMRGYAVRQLYTPGEIPRAPFKALFGRDILEVSALAEALRGLEASGKLRLEKGSARFLSVERVERQVWGKHLFSPVLRAALLRSAAKERRAFLKRHARTPMDELIPLSGKRVAALMRMYYHPSTPVLPLRRESRA